MKRNNAGSSLVEIVVATAIMGILVSAVCTSLMLGLRLNEKTDAQLKAQLAVSSTVETLMAEGIDPESVTVTVETTTIDGSTVMIEKGQHNVEFSDVKVETIRQKKDSDVSYPPYYKVIVSSTGEDVTVTTHIREAVPES